MLYCIQWLNFQKLKVTYGSCNINLNPFSAISHHLKISNTEMNPYVCTGLSRWYIINDLRKIKKAILLSTYIFYISRTTIKCKYCFTQTFIIICFSYTHDITLQAISCNAKNAYICCIPIWTSVGKRKTLYYTHYGHLICGLFLLHVKRLPWQNP